MTEQLIDIGRRLKALREIMDFDLEGLARKLSVTPAELEAFERGENDFSFSFLYNVANALGVDVLDLMSGDSPKLSSISLVRAGEGFEVKRRAAYSYKHLAFTFRNKKAEPFMVTVEPQQGDKLPEMHAHEGQEFNMMVDGTMEFFHGEGKYTLKPGDSVYFDASAPHAMRAVNDAPARFLAVVMK